MPDKKALTPETLREGLLFPVGKQPDEQEWLDAHASAWEAEREEHTAKRARFWRTLFRNALLPAGLVAGLGAAWIARGLGIDMLAVVQWAVISTFLGWFAGMASVSIED